MVECRSAQVWWGVCGGVFEPFGLWVEAGGFALDGDLDRVAAAVQEPLEGGDERFLLGRAAQLEARSLGVEDQAGDLPLSQALKYLPQRDVRAFMFDLLQPNPARFQSLLRRIAGMAGSLPRFWADWRRLSWRWLHQSNRSHRCYCKSTWCSTCC